MEKNEGKSTAQQRLWSPVFVAITVTSLCCFLVGQGLNSGTSVYLAFKGSSATLAGIGAAVFSGAAAVSRIACGPLADRKGRMVIVTAGGLVLLAGTLGAALLPGDELFVAWRTLQGIGFAAATTAAATAAADVLPVERLGEGIGYYGLGQAVAMSFGPAIALVLVATDPPENLFWGVSVSAALVILLSLFCRYERDPSALPETATYRRLAEQRRAQAGQGSGAGAQAAPDAGPLRRAVDGIFEPGALAGALPMMVMAPTFGFGIFFAGLYGTSLGVQGAGVFYTVSAFAMIATRLTSKSFMDRVAAIKVFAVSCVAGVVFVACMLYAGSDALDTQARTALFYFAGIPYGLSLGIALPINQAMAVKNSPAERWGAANGLFLLLNDIGIGGASAVWGVVNDSAGFPVTLCCVAACIVAALVAARFTYPPPDRRWHR